MYTTLFVGPMKCGKSKVLVEKAMEYLNKDQKILCFKPSLDTRDRGFIKSRDYEKGISAKLVQNAHEIHSEIENYYLTYRRYPDAVFIDEIMLFDTAIIGIIDYFIYHNSVEATPMYLWASGLNLDFKKEPFVLPCQKASKKLPPLTMHDLESQFDTVVPLYAKCDVCKNDALYTQRLINGSPASVRDPIVLVGDQQYQARCGICHVLKP